MTGRFRARRTSHGTARLVVVGAATSAFLGCAASARRGVVGGAEARVFRALNGCPAAIHAPVWAVMQLGSLAGVVVATGAGLKVLGPRTGGRLAVAGVATWAGAKGCKHLVRRGRPSTTLETCRELGRSQAGLGYPSGHAAVSAALATVAAASAPARAVPVLWGAASVAGFGRVYVGAHLPLDVAGGVAMGVGIGAAVLALDERSRHARPSSIARCVAAARSFTPSFR